MRISSNHNSTTLFVIFQYIYDYHKNPRKKCFFINFKIYLCLHALRAIINDDLMLRYQHGIGRAAQIIPLVDPGIVGQQVNANLQIHNNITLQSPITKYAHTIILLLFKKPGAYLVVAEETLLCVVRSGPAVGQAPLAYRVFIRRPQRLRQHVAPAVRRQAHDHFFRRHASCQHVVQRFVLRQKNTYIINAYYYKSTYYITF